MSPSRFGALATGSSRKTPINFVTHSADFYEVLYIYIYGNFAELYIPVPMLVNIENHNH